jgi:hypothetical protein
LLILITVSLTKFYIIIVFLATENINFVKL